VAIARRDFTAIPVRRLDLLWTGRVVGRRKGEARPPLIEIIVEGRDGDTVWTWGMELQYQGAELLYCRATESRPVPDPVRRLTVIHVPPLGGIQSDEEKREPGIQDRLIGEGKPGDILRNLLLQIAEREPDAWRRLSDHIEEIFQITLQKPVFSGTYITAEYVPKHTAAGRKPKPLEIAGAGSGFHQVLLLLAFFYARPGSVLLLDEPDAHLHIILQRDVYALIRRVASDRNAQLVISTHSEVILDETDPSRIVAFTGEHPHTLVTSSQKAQLKKALTRLRSLDFLLADQIRSVLYVEGETDAGILREWARILKHPAHDFLEKPFLHPLGGNDLGEAREHFYALREAYPDLRGACVLDRRDRPRPDGWVEPALFFWPRRETESYLLHPAALRRFIERKAPGAAPAVDRHFAKQLPPGFNPFDDGVIFLRDVKASEEFLLPLLGDCGLSTSKKDLFLIAAVMLPNEIHPEVTRALDVIATLGADRSDSEVPVGGAPASEAENGEEGEG
jgi:hypothetical protein